MEGSKLVNKAYMGGEETFKLLFSRYGESIFTMLVNRCGDKQIAREILKNIFADVYESLIGIGTVDITAVWLKSLAEVYLQQRGSAALLPSGAAPQNAHAGQSSIPQPQPEPVNPYYSSSNTNVKKKRSGYHIAAVVALGAAITGVIWAIIGLLMDIQVLPKADLGYNWFNTNIMDVF